MTFREGRRQRYHLQRKETVGNFKERYVYIKKKEREIKKDSKNVVLSPPNCVETHFVAFLTACPPICVSVCVTVYLNDYFSTIYHSPVCIFLPT